MKSAALNSPPEETATYTSGVEDHEDGELHDESAVRV